VACTHLRVDDVQGCRRLAEATFPEPQASGRM